MAANAHAPLGGRLLTPVTAILGLLVVIAGYFLAQRFMYGLGAVTNINDGYPWGIWIAWDVVVGTAFACGGFALALLVYILNRGEYHPLVRPALLASMFGYSLGGLSVIIDLGRWWNFWHMFSPVYADPSSVMLEVGLCVAAYVVVLWIEFTPAFLERFGMENARRKLNKVLFVFIALGVLLPTMHQSSLGTLLVVFGYQIHPLWQTAWLPLLFLVSALTMGFSIVILEGALAEAGLRHRMEIPLLAKLARIIAGLLSVFLAVRFIELIAAGELGLAFSSGVLSVMFWIETILFALPVVILANERNRTNPRLLFVAAASMLAAGALYRIDAFLVAYQTGAGWNYFPSLPEIMVTVGIVALEILGYIVFVKVFPVMSRAHGH